MPPCKRVKVPIPLQEPNVCTFMHLHADISDHSGRTFFRPEEVLIFCTGTPSQSIYHTGRLEALRDH